MNSGKRNKDQGRLDSDLQTRKSSFRKVSLQKYVVAGVLTLLIFSLGLSLGFMFQQERYDWATQVNEQQDIEYLSLQLQYLMLNSAETQETCAVLSTTLQKTVSDLSQSLAKIIEFEEEHEGISSSDFTLISRRYALDNMRYYLLATQALEGCDMPVVPILYFHSNDCTDCANQGTILTYYKKLLGEGVLVFPIDTDLADSEPMIQIFMSLYDVEIFPTLVVGDSVHPGFVSREDLAEKICEVQYFEEIC